MAHGQLIFVLTDRPSDRETLVEAWRQGERLWRSRVPGSWRVSVGQVLLAPTLQSAILVTAVDDDLFIHAVSFEDGATLWSSREDEQWTSGPYSLVADDRGAALHVPQADAVLGIAPSTGVAWRAAFGHTGKLRRLHLTDSHVLVDAIETLVWLERDTGRHLRTAESRSVACLVEDRPIYSDYGMVHLASFASEAAQGISWGSSNLMQSCGTRGSDLVVLAGPHQGPYRLLRLSLGGRLVWQVDIDSPDEVTRYALGGIAWRYPLRAALGQAVPRYLPLIERTGRGALTSRIAVVDLDEGRVVGRTADLQGPGVRQYRSGNYHLIVDSRGLTVFDANQGRAVAALVPAPGADDFPLWPDALTDSGIWYSDGPRPRFIRWAGGTDQQLPDGWAFADVPGALHAFGD